MRAWAIGAAVLLTAVGCGERAAASRRPVSAADVAKAEATCQAIGGSMNELTAQVKARLGTDDMAKVLPELQKMPEWKKLRAELEKASEDLAAKRSKVR